MKITKTGSRSGRTTEWRSPMNEQVTKQHLTEQVGFAALGAGLDFNTAKQAMRTASPWSRCKIEATIGTLKGQRCKLETMRAQEGNHSEH